MVPDDGRDRYAYWQGANIAIRGLPRGWSQFTYPLLAFDILVQCIDILWTQSANNLF